MELRASLALGGWDSCVEENANTYFCTVLRLINIIKDDAMKLICKLPYFMTASTYISLICRQVIYYY